MIHQPTLLEQIEKLPHDEFVGKVFRTTRLNADPIAFSSSGGRWAPPDENEGGFSILYTSLDRDGSLAEVASYLALLNPMPKKPLQVSTLSVTVSKALRVAIDAFGLLGINRRIYGERNYERTQEIA